jgi:hypothetical protein
MVIYGRKRKGRAIERQKKKNGALLVYDRKREGSAIARKERRQPA